MFDFTWDVPFLTFLVSEFPQAGFSIESASEEKVGLFNSEEIDEFLEIIQAEF